LRPDARRVFLKGRRGGRGPLDALFTGAMSVIASAALRARLTDVNAQPKLFHRSFLPHLRNAPKDFALDLVALLRARRAGLHVVTHDVRFGARRFGEAKGGGGPSLRRKLRLGGATLRRITQQAMSDLKRSPE
jgi:hypothetical protein